LDTFGYVRTDKQIFLYGYMDIFILYHEDEIIINFVRENHCLYDKRDVDFKNVSKKEICEKKYPKI